MDDVIRVKDQFYVLATSALADDRTRVLKYGETFAVFNRLGDIESVGLGEHGIYHQETRHLSRFVLRLGRRPPQFLRSSVREDNALLSVDMMNLDISHDGQVIVPRGTLHLFRSKFLWKNACHEYLRISNYSLSHVDTFVSFDFQADFADIFEVRGMKREQRGVMLAPQVNASTVTLSYRGRDHLVHRAKLEFSPDPAELTHDQAVFRISLEPKKETAVYITTSCEQMECCASRLTFEDAHRQLVRSLNDAGAARTRVTTSNRQFGAWIARSDADLRMMIAGNPEGDYPYAGVPWFSTVFGRDGIITAMECLWLSPSIAKSVLKYLSENQATEFNEEEDAEPGKILHEVRRGEMASLKEIPFKKYYGSIDVTPLFIMLAAAYLARTDDVPFIRSIWPNILAALDWISRYGDCDGDGFVEYHSKSTHGLVHQGWKDSWDAISHADGSLAEPPIALCEVQGYVYSALRSAARIATALGSTGLVQSLEQQSEALREKFDRAFWNQDLGTFALALDGDKNPCAVKASNAGHCLFTGIAKMERAASVMRALMGEEMFCGWGIRTLGSMEVRYNPLSYHDGSVWPHDNAMIARGFASYGFKNEALAVLEGLMESSAFMQSNRLPELFCGCHRRAESEGPTLYPVACSPQSWAAASVYMLLEALLGIEVDPRQKCVKFWHPCLPSTVNDLCIESLRVGESSADIMLTKSHGQVVPALVSHTGRVSVEFVGGGE